MSNIDKTTLMQKGDSQRIDQKLGAIELWPFPHWSLSTTVTHENGNLSWRLDGQVCSYH